MDRFRREQMVIGSYGTTPLLDHDACVLVIFMRMKREIYGKVPWCEVQYSSFARERFNRSILASAVGDVSLFNTLSVSWSGIDLRLLIY